MFIGIDVGGTHTDGVLIREENSEYKVDSTEKVLTDHDNLKNSILELTDRLTADIENKNIRRLVLSTTLVTNLIYENKYDPVGLLLIPGPGLNPDYFKYGEENIILDGYIDHRGKIVREPETEEIRKALETFEEKEIKNLAVVSKFSVRNPSLEEKVKEVIAEEDYNFKNISLGYKLSGSLNFHRRIITAYFNTAVIGTQKNFIDSIKSSLKARNIDSELYLLKCDGGTTNLNDSLDIPIETVNSGPAASIMGTKLFNKRSKTGIAIDIGGTTTDFGIFINGDPVFKPRGIEIADHPTLIRGLFSQSLALGGDSEVHVENGKIKIGPQRKGAAAALGGPAPTPTDALLILGKIENDKEQNLDFDSKRAEKALESLKEEIDEANYKSYLQNNQQLNPEITAKIIVDKIAQMIKDKVNSIIKSLKNKPVYTINELLESPEINAEYLIGIGGPAASITKIIADKLNLEAIVPEHSKVANAVGAALAHPTIETTVRADTARGWLDIVEADIHRKIKDKNFDLEDARELAKKWTLKRFSESSYPVEIISEESFNVIRNYRTAGKIIEIKAQIKPGHIADLKGGKLII